MLVPLLVLPQYEQEESEPSLDPESSEHEAMGTSSTLNSLAGYSPSPAGIPFARKGFNLLLPDGIQLDCSDPAHPSEVLALRAMHLFGARSACCLECRVMSHGARVTHRFLQSIACRGL